MPPRAQLEALKKKVNCCLKDLTQKEAGLGVSADPDWMVCPPARPAGHNPAQNYADSRKGSVSPILAPAPCKNS